MKTKPYCSDALDSDDNKMTLMTSMGFQVTLLMAVLADDNAVGSPNDEPLVSIAQIDSEHSDLRHCETKREADFKLGVSSSSHPLGSL